jgi:hypothetical protein
MGMSDGPRARADQALLERYTTVTREVRTVYSRVLGLGDAVREPISTSDLQQAAKR